LNVPVVARQLGELLRRLHAVELDGFGFIDTDRLRRDGVLTGLDRSYADYFDKRLEDHLGYLADHGLLEPGEIREVRRLLNLHRPLLQRSRGVLVHRDPALWNVLGTPERITAVIDWDDAVSGDPADDLGVLCCFHDADFMDAVMAGYDAAGSLPDDFQRRIWLHCLRNMLWKAMLRDYMGYFAKDDGFFLSNTGRQGSLRSYTFNKIRQAMARLKE
ncbi:MAG: aminoglycoside phosphotransferase family protein, partial [Lentisphaerae bacterium]|nr:aminoglycoside phosphotransferase family protein [Lentisphaerota bacterium]